MKEEQVILVNTQDEVIGYAPKMAAHKQALLHRAFSVFIFNNYGELLMQQRASHKYHSPKLWTNTVCSHQRKGESNLAAGKRRLKEEMGLSANLQELFHFIYKAPFDNGLTEHELDHVMIGFSNMQPQINPEEVMDFRWMSLSQIAQEIAEKPDNYTEWFKIIFKNSLQKLTDVLDLKYLTEPLKFSPVFKEKPWGGQKLKHILNKDIPSNKTGESWEISTVSKNYSIIKKGYFEGKTLPELIQKYPIEILGQNVYQKYGYDFPLLIKYIDAADDLSIQVHPDDKMAQKDHQSFGKNELWHIIQADSDSLIYVGFKTGIDQNTYLSALKEGRLNELMQQIKVKAGDTIYIPAGTVHAIGKGILLAEIQQTSDITYRIFDWNRTGLDGKPRALHTKQAMKAIKFEKRPVLETGKQIKTPYFTFEKMPIEKNMNLDLSNLDSFVILMNPSGSYKINGHEFQKGDTLLLPAIIDKIAIEVLEKGYILKINL